MNNTELRILSRNLGCKFNYAEWRPYYQNKSVAYKKARTCLVGHNVMICVWSKKTTFNVLDNEGEIWFSFNIGHEYSLYLWSKEQVDSYLLQQIALQRTKEMFSKLAYAELENSYSTHWSTDPCLY